MTLACVFMIESLNEVYVTECETAKALFVLNAHIYTCVAFDVTNINTRII